MSDIIKPGKKFGNATPGVECGGSWQKDIYEKVVRPTRKNLVPYNDISRALMMARGDIERAQEMITKKHIPSNPDVMLDFHNRLCDLEDVVVKLCSVVTNELGYDPNRKADDE